MQKWIWTQKEGMGLPELGESKCHRAGTQVLGVSMQGEGCPLLPRSPPARPPTTMPLARGPHSNTATQERMVRPPLMEKSQKGEAGGLQLRNYSHWSSERNNTISSNWEL